MILKFWLDRIRFQNESGFCTGSFANCKRRKFNFCSRGHCLCICRWTSMLDNNGSFLLNKSNFGSSSDVRCFTAAVIFGMFSNDDGSLYLLTAPKTIFYCLAHSFVKICVLKYDQPAEFFRHWLICIYKSFNFIPLKQIFTDFNKKK